MNSQEIIDYVMNTPYNTNPAILKQMIDEAGGSSIGAVSWNDLTDKPFDKQVTEVELENKTVTFDAPKDYARSHGKYDLVAGKEYIVVWNDVEYVRTAYEVYNEYNKAVGLGNVTACGEIYNEWSGDDTGEPFFIQTDSGDTFISSAAVGEVHFILKTMEEVVTPIPEEFLPKSVFKNGDTRFCLESPDGNRFWFMVNNDGELVPWEK